MIPFKGHLYNLLDRLYIPEEEIICGWFSFCQEKQNKFEFDLPTRLHVWAIFKYQKKDSEKKRGKQGEEESEWRGEEKD